MAERWSWCCWSWLTVPEPGRKLLMDDLTSQRNCTGLSWDPVSVDTVSRAGAERVVQVGATQGPARRRVVNGVNELCRHVTGRKVGE